MTSIRRIPVYCDVNREAEIGRAVIDGDKITVVIEGSPFAERVASMMQAGLITDLYLGYQLVRQPSISMDWSEPA
jgi:hypothetical protein